MWDRPGFTVGGVVIGVVTVEGSPALAVDPQQGSRCMKGQRMEMIKK
jgi:hypothetical protein